MSYTKSDSTTDTFYVDSIVGSEIVAGSGSKGARYLIIDKPAGPSARLVGAYNSNIKITGSFKDQDTTKTLSAVQDCDITLYGMPTDGAAAMASNRGIPYDNTSGNKWPEMVEFLSQSQFTQVQGFAILSPRQMMLSGANYVNRWEVTGGKRPLKSERTGPALNSNDFIESCNQAAPKWAAAATEMSYLSLTYPNFIGFTIDDFQGHVWRKGSWGTPATEPIGTARVRSQGYSRANVQQIYRGCQHHNPDFQFWPTHYVGAALKNAIPAITIVGFTYDFPTLANEYVAATRRFWVKETALGGTLKFLYTDYYGTDDAHIDPHDVHKYCHLNGVQILSESIGGDDRIQIFEHDCAGNLKSGWNTLTWKVVDVTTTNAFTERLFAIGDLRFIQRNENRLDSPTTTLTPENGGFTSASWDINGAPTGSHPGTNTTPGNTALLPFSGGWVAETNDDYRYIADCDRFLLYYTNHTGAIKARLPTIFDAYRRHCPQSGIIHGQQGFLFNQDIVKGTQVQKFKTGSAYSDGVVVWNYPLYMNKPTDGIFSQRSITSDVALTASNLIQTAWPSWQSAVRGQYQRFTTKKSYDGDLTFRVRHVGGGGADTDDGFKPYWRTILANSSAAWPPTGPYYNISGASNYTTPLSSSVIPQGHKLVFETFVTGGYGDSYLQARLSASVGDVYLSASAWDFKSGVTGSIIPDLYSSLKTYYASLDTDTTSYNNYIVERTRGLPGPDSAEYWTFFDPKDGMRVYITDDDEYRIYSKSKETWMREITYHDYSDALIVSGSVACTDAVTRGGFFHATRAATASFNWASPSSLSGAISWDSYPRLDTKYYSGSGTDIMIRESGDYKIAYGISWYQTGSLPPISLKAYVVSSSLVGTPAAPFPKPHVIRTLDSSLSYTVIDGPPAGYTRGSNSATFMTSIRSTDTLKLYVEHDYGTLPSTTSTVAKQTWIIIEKV